MSTFEDIILKQRKYRTDDHGDGSGEHFLKKNEMGKEIVTYHEQMTYVGNMLTSVRDDASHSAYAGATDFDGVSGQEYPLTYNASGSLTSDAGRGIAWIDYDLNNHPVRIQFTNGNVTKYVYSATGEKLHVTHQTAVPNISVPIGSTRELTPYEIQYTDYTNYLLGGCLTLRNGRIDKYQFEEGYCQAERYVYDASQDEFTFCYYDRDHLGNIRQVTEADGSSVGSVIQKVNYYPFGAEFCDGTANSSVQPYKYNGKELDVMHGLNTYDYGARQYNPVTAHWDRVDPLCEKYYNVSPYVYCHNNPIVRIDPNGRDDYHLYANGTLIYQKNDEKTDRLIANKKSIVIRDKKLLPQLQKHRWNYDGHFTTTSNSIDAGKLFKFLSDNSNVEWGMEEYSTEGGMQYLIRTSHNDNRVSRTNGGFNDLDLVLSIHSHPKGPAKASGPYNGGYVLVDEEGDWGGVHHTYQKFNEAGINSKKWPKFYIYNVPTKEKIQYSDANNSIKTKKVTSYWDLLR